MSSFFPLLLRLASVAAFLLFTSFPQHVLAFEYEQNLLHQHLEFLREAEIGEAQVAGARDSIELQTTIPKPGDTFTVLASAYSSTVSQTDDDPLTTASGRRVRIGTIAANFLPLGSIVHLDGRTYVVEDRMNARFNGQRWIDIWMTTPEMARHFGVRTLTLEIIHIP